MTAIELAFRFGGKKLGKDWMFICPAHRDTKPSLAVREGKTVPLIFNCRSHQCRADDILKAWGLSWKEIQDGKASPEIKAQMTLKERRSALERRLALIYVLAALEQTSKAYCAAAERGILRDLSDLRCRIEPEQVWREYWWNHVWREDGHLES